MALCASYLAYRRALYLHLAVVVNMGMRHRLEALRVALIEPIQYRSPALMVQRCEQLIHQHTGGRGHWPARRLVQWLRPPLPLPTSEILTNPYYVNGVLSHLGYCILDWKLSSKRIQQITSWAFATPGFATDDPELRLTTVTPDRQDWFRFTWRVEDLLTQSIFLDILAEPLFYSIAQLYLRCRPTLTSFKLWFDPANDRPHHVHHYHYDNDSPHFLKFYIYLNDTTPESGTHAFIAGTHDPRKPRPLRRNRLFSRDEIIAAYDKPPKEIIFEVPAGTIVAEDTAGFHRAIQPTKRYRFVLQIQFSCIDIPEQSLTETWHKAKIPMLDPSIAWMGRNFISA